MKRAGERRIIWVHLVSSSCHLVLEVDFCRLREDLLALTLISYNAHQTTARVKSRPNDWRGVCTRRKTQLDMNKHTHGGKGAGALWDADKPTLQLQPPNHTAAGGRLRERRELIGENTRTETGETGHRWQKPEFVHPGSRKQRLRENSI